MCTVSTEALWRTYGPTCVSFMHVNSMINYHSDDSNSVTTEKLELIFREKVLFSAKNPFDGFKDPQKLSSISIPYRRKIQMRFHFFEQKTFPSQKSFSLIGGRKRFWNRKKFLVHRNKEQENNILFNYRYVFWPVCLPSTLRISLTFARSPWQFNCQAP